MLYEVITKLLHSLDESMEAKAIAHEVQKLLDEGADPNEIAVLYRINALSRSLEEGFTKAGLGFKLIGGMRFYERAEIKDLISRITSYNVCYTKLLRVRQGGDNGDQTLPGRYHHELRRRRKRF